MAQLILDYIKAILSPQVIAGAVGFTLLALFRDDFKALLLRVAKIRLPGGTEVSTSQITKAEEAAENKPLDRAPAADPPPPLPASLDHKELQQVKQLLDAERARGVSMGIPLFKLLSRLSYAASARLVCFFILAHIFAAFRFRVASPHPQRGRTSRHRKRIAGPLPNPVAWRSCGGYAKRKRIHRLAWTFATAEGLTLRCRHVVRSSSLSLIVFSWFCSP